MKQKYIFRVLVASLFLWGCDKKNSDLVKPLTADEFPQVIRFDDEGDGETEDADAFHFTLTLNDKTDPSGKELGGIPIPLEEDVTVHFKVTEQEGFDQLADYIKGGKAFYEIDDCTTSEDAGLDLPFSFDPATGTGTVVFPKGITELEVEFETDEDLLNDDVLNEDERSISFVLTGVDGGGPKVTFNPAIEFKYEVLDDEGIQSEWELDHEDPAAFAAFKQLFSRLDESIATLEMDEVDKIVIAVEYDEVKVEIELKETEMVTECGETEEKNKMIELEAELEELSAGAPEGEIEFVGEIEQADESIKEFAYKGAFLIQDGILQLVLTGEYDGEETEETTLTLYK